MALATVIMAAGKGKRMNNPEKSKVMFELHGKPMIEYVVDLALEIGSEKVVVIVGHKRETVIDFILDRYFDQKERIKFATQEEQLWTGHAVMQANDALSEFIGDVLILSGDVPLLQKETVSRFLETHRTNNWTASLISWIPENQFGYGRILRNEAWEFVDIREEKDASEQEKLIREINSGIYLVNSQKLFQSLSLIKSDNAQNEYYLTDIFSDFRNQKELIGAVPAQDIIEITWVNTIEQLAELEKNFLWKWKVD